ncbi:hypothetical protein TPA0909_00900 [Streptomyces albus]|nr:hypothetical protein [Streptomyces albus]GHJ18476.1 hypothetical protein TPA0909_00900 [Streptomyces albus]
MLVVAARHATVHAFATFSLVYTVFTVLLGLTVAYVGQALVLENGPVREVARACRSAVAFTALAATALGLPAAAVLGAAGGWRHGHRAGHPRAGAPARPHPRDHPLRLRRLHPPPTTP